MKKKTLLHDRKNDAFAVNARATLYIHFHTCRSFSIIHSLVNVIVDDNSFTKNE